MVTDSFAAVFFAPPPDPPHAAATKAMARAAAPTARARCMRMGLRPLPWSASGRFGRGGRPDEGGILAWMAPGEASRHHEALHERQRQLGQNRQESHQDGA